MWVHVAKTIKTEVWCIVIVCVLAIVVVEVSTLSGPNVCMVKQKYNITKRVKYRAPMSVRTYEWCFSMPPRCSRWTTEMRDLTRLETEERTAEVAVCCPGYKMKDVSCVPICTNGKTGPDCTEDCPPNKWGPNCINTCKKCKNGFCSRLTGECECIGGWQGESCDVSMPTGTTTTSLEELLTTLSTKITTVTTNTTPKSTITTAISSPKSTVTSRTTFATTPATIVTFSIVNVTSTIMPTIRSPKTTISMHNNATTIIPSISNTLTTPKIASPSKILKATEKSSEASTPISTTAIPKLSKIDYKTTYISTNTTKNNLYTEDVTVTTTFMPNHGNTDETDIIRSTESVISFKNILDVGVQKSPTSIITTKIPKITTTLMFPKEVAFSNETSQRDTTTNRLITSTPKFKAKEIWIRPAQKGESPIVDAKIKAPHDFPRYRSANNKELVPVVTTPKTIIVSIIPTSISYSTFKRIYLTSSYMSNKNSSNVPSYPQYNVTDQGSPTVAMLPVTSKPTIALNTFSNKEINSTSSYGANITILPSTSVVPNISSTKAVTMSTDLTKIIFHINRTNSMTPDINKSIFTTTNLPQTSPKRNDLFRTSIISHFKTTTSVRPPTDRTTKHFVKQILPTKPKNISSIIQPYNTTNTSKFVEKETKLRNVTKDITKLTTEGPIDDEEFHILTEPEHITAVMGDKDTDRSSVDLISVISIAGGVMMAVITVAVIIVMIERCKKPRYEDVRKINDIRMQVMIDGNDAPPPYVRSIFHTPLPEPPNSDRCHYQPISTLDRNLKQFMRPVVVQTISPIMLENFRGILECHYDHLPRRSNDFETIQMRSSLAPSVKNHSELQQLRGSVTESAIEALKCEAKLDIIDNTTSEPLYAEIPCWRPPSEHAIEILNMNGEAVTEL